MGQKKSKSESFFVARLSKKTYITFWNKKLFKTRENHDKVWITISSISEPFRFESRKKAQQAVDAWATTGDPVAVLDAQEARIEKRSKKMPRERKFFTVAVNRVALESCTMQVLAVSEAAAKKRAVDLLNDVVDRRSGESQSTWQFRSVTKRPKVVSVTANGQAEVAVASVPSTPDSAPDQDDPEDADEGGFDDEDSEDDGEG